MYSDSVSYTHLDVYKRQWEQPSQMITDIGTLTFHASYIPDDTINYQTIKQIPIEISSAKGQNQLVSMRCV